jgi:DNA-binding CsgD family transcriptional regulator
MFSRIGAVGFAARAGQELRATGETARKRAAAAANQELTAQEAQIAQLARDGLSNPEIGARLFLRPRTVQYHLGNVFAKLGISSRASWTGSSCRAAGPPSSTTGPGSQDPGGARHGRALASCARHWRMRTRPGPHDTTWQQAASKARSRAAATSAAS